VVTTTHISPETFKLGDFPFRFSSSNIELLDQARSMYLSIQMPSSSEPLVFDLDAVEARIIANEQATVFHTLITQAYRHHLGHIYMDGCVFVTPDKKLVLLVGVSHSGKTTMTFAAVRQLGWKILAEDRVIINPTNNHIVRFVHPLSIREGTQELIEEATGLPPLELYLNRWLADTNMFYSDADIDQAKFSVSILLEGGGPNIPFRVTNASMGEFLRALLPMSNALHVDEGPECLASFIEQSKYHVVTAGTVGQRLEAFETLTRQSADRS